MLSQIDQPEVAVIVASKSLLNPGPDADFIKSLQ